MKKWGRYLLLAGVLPAALTLPAWAGEEPGLYKLRRDPFNFAAVKPPEKPAEEAKSPEEPPVSFTLRATLVGRERSLANLDGQILAEGGELNGYRLVKIDEDEVVLEKEGKQLTVFLKK